MKYTEEEKRHWLILQCRYYKGETKPPKTLPEGYALMWDYEMRWVYWNLHYDKGIESLQEEIKAFNLETKPGDKWKSRACLTP